jgi:hypothetical protein
MEEIVLKITRTPEGNVQVEGPLDNKMLCYGMLGIAHEAVMKAGSKIVKPDFAIPPDLRRPS